MDVMQTTTGSSSRATAAFQRIIAATVVAVMAAVMDVVFAAPAHADGWCKEFIGGSNDDTATGYSYGPDGSKRGYVTWSSDGERLRVVDTSSNGRRIVALFSYCVNGTWHDTLYRDSGPNEGPIDVEKYDFDFAEGRAITFQPCEIRMASKTLYNCGVKGLVHA
ncbi:hypothetical protein [Microlunatus soli]|uniref:Uncharacterized protein n=1 Tax=Microlunatus soli TaxID=630515 RepID=A0A1H1R8R2_9ACTN|nr:hypothetical protein [Microlunatus soli]SDS32088.1 hypothetical protein SAMN04489812_1554 [Microlunatus soli]